MNTKVTCDRRKPLFLFIFNYNTIVVYFKAYRKIVREKKTISLTSSFMLCYGWKHFVDCNNFYLYTISQIILKTMI